MPRSTIGGDDPDHQLPDEEKDRRESELRKEARALLKAGKPKARKELLGRALNISREESKIADHH